MTEMRMAHVRNIRFNRQTVLPHDLHMVKVQHHKEIRSSDLFNQPEGILRPIGIITHMAVYGLKQHPDVSFCRFLRCNLQKAAALFLRHLFRISSRQPAGCGCADSHILNLELRTPVQKALCIVPNRFRVKSLAHDSGLLVAIVVEADARHACPVNLLDQLLPLCLLHIAHFVSGQLNKVITTCRKGPVVLCFRTTAEFHDLLLFLSPGLSANSPPPVLCIGTLK